MENLGTDDYSEYPQSLNVENKAVVEGEVELSSSHEPDILRSALQEELPTTLKEEMMDDGSGQMDEFHQTCFKEFSTSDLPSVELNTDEGRYFESKLFEAPGKKTENSSEVRDKEIECQVCKKKFRDKVRLDIHEKIHTGETPYDCDVCSHSSKNYAAFLSHKRVHTGEQPYKCERCGIRYKQINDLRRHEREKHTGTEPKFRCEICFRQFFRQNILTRHMMIHGEKLSCRFCQKKFSRKAKLQDHLRRHTGERPYRCKACTSSFISTDSLNKHKCDPKPGKIVNKFHEEIDNYKFEINARRSAVICNLV